MPQSNYKPLRACVLFPSVGSDSVQPSGLQPTRLFCPWDSPDKNIGVGCHALLQGIFPTQGLNPGLLCLLHRKPILTPEQPEKSN